MLPCLGARVRSTEQAFTFLSPFFFPAEAVYFYVPPFSLQTQRKKEERTCEIALSFSFSLLVTLFPFFDNILSRSLSGHDRWFDVLQSLLEAKV